MRFKGVDDVQKLERQMDNLSISGLKIHANLPKHGWKGKTTKILHKKDQYKQGSFRDMQVDRANGKDKEITAQTPRENLNAETTNTQIIPKLPTLFEHFFVGRRHVAITITTMVFDPTIYTTFVFI